MEEVLGPVCGDESEDVRLLGVVGGSARDGVVDADRVADVVEERALAEGVLVLVQEQHQVFEDCVEHLPAALAHGRWKREKND